MFGSGYLAALLAHADLAPWPGDLKINTRQSPCSLYGVRGEEDDLFLLVDDPTKGPRAPAAKPGRVTPALRE
jgi:hypothetical protein